MIVAEDETDTEESDEEESVSCFSCKKIFKTNDELIYHKENSCATESRVCVAIGECKSGCFLTKNQKLALISNLTCFSAPCCSKGR